MNFKLVSVAAALAVSAAIAQDYEDEEESTEAPAAEETVQEEEAPAPAKKAAVEEESSVAEEVAEAPATPATGLSVLHGNAYNLVGNEAGASTIGGNMASPYKMYGSNLLYVEPSGENGTLALTKGGMTYLLGFDNSAIDNTIGIATFGIAMKGMGFALDIGIDKTWTSEEESTTNTKETTDVSTTAAGDIINLKFGMLLGAFDLTANVYWLTFRDEEDTEEEMKNGNMSTKAEEDNDYWDIGGNITISNGPSAKSLFWSAGLDVLRQSSTTEVKTGNTTTETTHNDAYFMLQPHFNFAMPVFSNEGAQVFFGLNTRLPIYIYDEIENGNSKSNVFSMALYTTPNVLGEMSLTENWIIFAGAAYEWKVFGLRSEEIEQGVGKEETSIMTMKTYSTTANAGARFQYKNLILEASIADALGSSSWSGLIGRLGAFLTF